MDNKIESRLFNSPDVKTQRQFMNNLPYLTGINCPFCTLFTRIKKTTNSTHKKKKLFIYLFNSNQIIV